MKKLGMISIALASVMTVGMLAACGGEKEHYDMEKDPFVMGIQTPDGVFNPFFSTSMYDSNIISWTQIGMLNTDKEGNISCGEDEMCVVKNYATKYDASESNGVDNDEYQGVTTYQLALKNGIKFSDGEDLTIKDVLFNLYTYLDINYTGSSTIYSTKILGLEAYRTDNPNATDSSVSTFEETYRAAAETRKQDLLKYVRKYSQYVDSKDKDSIDISSLDRDKVEKDFLTVKEEFWKELNTDWNSTAANMETYRKQLFEEAWQVFLWQDGGDNTLLQMEQDGTTPKQDADKNYLFDKDSRSAKDYAADLKEYLDTHEGDKDALTKQWACEIAFSGYFPVYAHDDASDITEKQMDLINPENLEMILDYSASSEAILNKFAAQAKEEFLNGKGGRQVKTISGITTFKSDKIEGDSGEISLGEECDILQIKIRGVDPKAIYNFSFLVAPLHYYSGEYEGVDYIKNFNGDVASNPATADQVTGEVYFGLKTGSTGFMDDVINAPEKVGLPVGAGPYMASSRAGTETRKSAEFFNLNRVYYQRNPYFETVGDQIENAKIKYMQYFVVPADQYLTNLKSGDLDYADPSASKENVAEATKMKGFTNETIQTAGYGYVGINPRYVPNIYVRRAIMKAFNRDTIFNNYYPNGLAERIYRPMSKANWAYPTGATEYKTSDTNGAEGWDGSYRYDGTGEVIEAIVQAAGYTKVDGVYQKAIPGFQGKNGNIDRLEYTFTIAGASSDHPAYKMLIDARTLLNNHGFKIKVTTSQTALSDLTLGKLAVWAAAWTSTVDPDMYQVYHMDSKATSVNNWGYSYIKKNANGAYAKELNIITDLSDYIDDGRAVEDHNARAPIYKNALDLVMELAVEYPTYQRVDLFVFNTKKLKRSSMPPHADLGAYNSLLARIWEVEYN